MSRFIFSWDLVVKVIVGSLRNLNGDTEYNTYESRDTHKSFTLFITVKTIEKLNPEQCDKFEIKI